MTPLQTEALQDSARIAGAPTHRPSCRQDTKKGTKPPRIQSQKLMKTKKPSKHSNPINPEPAHD